MLHGEHSAILSTFIKLPFVIKIIVLSIFEWPLKTGFTVNLTCRHGSVSFTRQRILTDVLNAPSKPNARGLHPDSDVNVTAHWLWKKTIRILQDWSLSMLSVLLTGFLIQSFRWTISRAMKKCSASRCSDQGPCFCHGAHRHPISQYTWTVNASDFHTYSICEQQRLWRVWVYAQTHQSHRCSHTQSTDVAECADLNKEF